MNRISFDWTVWIVTCVQTVSVAARNDVARTLAVFDASETEAFVSTPQKSFFGPRDCALDDLWCQFQTSADVCHGKCGRSWSSRSPCCFHRRSWCDSRRCVCGSRRRARVTGTARCRSAAVRGCGSGWTTAAAAVRACSSRSRTRRSRCPHNSFGVSYGQMRDDWY